MKITFICFLVVALVSVSLADTSYDNDVSESKDINAKVLASFQDKNKRGAVKLTNADNAGFNHLAASNTGGVSSSGFKPSSAVVANPPPFKYLYSNQYYQPYQANPYLTYVQIPHAAQIAAQYAFQANPAAHYLQTPTQIQYVSAPTVAQVPQIKYQTFSNDYSAASQASSAGASTVSSQYVSPSHQQAVASPSQTYVSSAGSASQAAAAATSSAAAATTTATQSKVQVPAYNAYQTTQSVYYPQQQFFTYVPQAHVSPSNFIYQQPGANYFLKQQQQLLNFYGGHRFGFYNPAQTGQFTYLVPMAVAPAVPVSEQTTTSDLKTSDKTLSTNQNTASTTFNYATKG